MIIVMWVNDGAPILDTLYKAYVSAVRGIGVHILIIVLGKDLSDDNQTVPYDNPPQL